MGFEIGQKIDFNGVGALWPAAQTHKILTQVPTPPPPPREKVMPTSGLQKH